ncbi:MAG TPA: fumarylacetoacetate hydrolase family protein [Vineibacter sp.]|nr:fumarylacetoacetate hydrolase family protein [Vineibacter sp.]
MSVLDGPRKELRRVIHGGSAYWAEYRDNALHLDDGRVIPEADVQHLPPCTPGKILCVHVNYRSRYWEFTGSDTAPETPTYFQKPITALNAHGGELIRPEGYKYLNYEGEVAAVIGKVTRNVSREQVWDHLLGFAAGNDVGLHDMRDTDAGSMLRVKGPDGFCPIGPGIVSGIDIRKSTLRTYRNGKLSQEGAISEMIFGIDYLVADLARHITLMPGDIIMTGTPANSRPMEVGDLIEVEVSQVGRLSNRVVTAPAPGAAVGHQPTDSEGVRRVALGNDERLPARLKQPA